MNFRPAIQQDLPFLWEALYFAASMHKGETEDRTAAMRDPELAPYLEGWKLDADLGVVAELEGQPVGAAWLRLRPGESQTKAHVDDFTPELVIAVFPQHTGQGIGKLLLAHLIAAAKDRFPAITLSVRTHNPAVRLYERAGFEVLREVTNRVGGTSYVMVKPLHTHTGAHHA